MTLRVNYIAPADHTGYACAAAQYVRLLAAHGVKVHFQPLLPGPGFGLWYECSPVSQAESGLRQELMLDADTVLHTIPEYYAPLTEWLRERGVRGRIAGMTVWETSRLPRHWPALLNRMDAVIVPSAWNRAIFLESGVTRPVFCLPHASEFEGRAAQAASLERLRARLPEIAGKFVFYSIGAWNHRKGNDLLLKAFGKAFPGRDDVSLILKTSPQSVDPQAPRCRRAIRRLLRDKGYMERARSGTDPRIVVLTDEMSSEEIAALHGVGHCYVSCARGEGWGIGLYEAVWFGKPFLAPDRGGQRAYLESDDLSGLVRSVPVRVRTPGRDPSYTSDQRWDEVDVRSVVQGMRRVVKDVELYRAEADALAKEMRQRFGGEVIADTFLTILDTLSKGVPSE
jgi:glycosyltransferase involved in cell wall biosynthesis